MENIHIAFRILFWGFVLFLVSTVVFAGIFIVRSTAKTVIVKSKTPPTISYELSTDGKKVDTVFLYTFKK